MTLRRQGADGRGLPFCYKKGNMKISVTSYKNWNAAALAPALRSLSEEMRLSRNCNGELRYPILI